jgi:hypothetical protein
VGPEAYLILGPSVGKRIQTWEWQWMFI